MNSNRYLRYMFYAFILILVWMTLEHLRRLSPYDQTSARKTDESEVRRETPPDATHQTSEAGEGTTAAAIPASTQQQQQSSLLENRDPWTIDLLQQQQKKKECKPVENVIFVKTHKTGSSTIINILQRYSDRHNLTVALPADSIFLGWPHIFDENPIYKYTDGTKYNFICNHAIFNKEKMLGLMTNQSRTKIVTILRDPLTQLESGAVYFNYTRMFGLPYNNHFIDEFFKDIQERINLMKSKGDSIFSLLKNPNTFDMGYSIWDDNPGTISKILENVRRDFDIVLISERMEESLIMLKNELCWDFEDILYFVKNKRPNSIRQTINDTDKAKEMIKDWSKIDHVLYKHFNQTLNERMRSGGEKFQEDLQKLRSIQRELTEKCLKDVITYEPHQPINVLKFQLKDQITGIAERSLCEQMLRTEVDYTQYLMRKLNAQKN